MNIVITVKKYEKLKKKKQRKEKKDEKCKIKSKI